MKADKIHISQVDFVSLIKLEIDRETGGHATAAVTGYIADEKVNEYRFKVLDHIWVTVSAEDGSGENRLLMTGVIAGFRFDTQPHAVLMTLVLKSGTYLMDRTEHFRSYQDGGRTCLEVLESITGAYGMWGIKGEECLEKTSCGFLLQYRETDWAFIKRLAGRFGLSVTPAITNEGVYYYVGKVNHASRRLPATVGYRVCKRVDDYMEQGASGRGAASERDYLEYQVTVREIYDLWDELAVGNEGGCVCRIHSEYRRGELLHTYTLRPGAAMGAVGITNLSLSGCSFQAEVKEVMQDSVRIALEGDENGNQEITAWFPYSTGYSSPDGAGWYCMPEPGDRVRLQIPGESEEEGYVISSVHQAAGAARKNPDYKSFRTKYGKELLFTPDSVEMTNHRGMSIKITDGEGIAMTSSKDISITAGGGVTLSSEEGSIVIAGSTSVDIRQGEAGLHMEDDVSFTGGAFRIQ